MNLRYDISDKPNTISLISLALQQMFAILAATIAVPMIAAFAGGVSTVLGMLGLILGAASAGVVYVILAVAVKKTGVDWIEKTYASCCDRSHSFGNRAFTCRECNK